MLTCNDTATAGWCVGVQYVPLVCLSQVGVGERAQVWMISRMNIWTRDRAGAVAQHRSEFVSVHDQPSAYASRCAAVIALHTMLPFATGQDWAKSSGAQVGIEIRTRWQLSICRRPCNSYRPSRSVTGAQESMVSGRVAALCPAESSLHAFICHEECEPASWIACLATREMSAGSTSSRNFWIF
jgi:hypothetical protein